MEESSFLRSVTLFSSFDPQEIDILSKSFIPMHFGEGDTILEEGKSNRALHVVKNGRVRVSRVVDGRDMALTDLAPGQTFGELSIMDAGVASATLHALSDCDVTAVAMNDLASFLSARPAAAAKFWREIAVDLRRRLLQTNDLVRSYFEINQSLADNPTLRKLYAMCNS